MNMHKQRGMTLVELMVALAIGAFLMIGAITVFMQSRTTFRVSESLSRMQENARFALDLIETDVRMAHYWGLNTITSTVANRAGPPPAANGLGPDDCGVNMTINLDQAVQGSNNSYPWICAGFPAVEVTADTLFVRHASEDIVVPVAGGLHIQSVRGTADSQIFVGAAAPGLGPTARTFRLITNGYYVSRSSSLGNGVPSLRQKFWPAAGGPVQDQELIVGVEDMQIQFGIDTDLPGQNDRGSVDRYVNPNDPLVEPFNPASSVEILSVRVWLRVRAERIENGFTDNVVYQYAGQNFGPFNDAFRRMVVSKTIYLRNARPNS